MIWFYNCLNIHAYFIKDDKKKKNVVNLRDKKFFIDDKKNFSLDRKLYPFPEKRFQEA